MGAVSTVKHRQSTINKIKATLLVKKLQKHALGECDMTNSQVKAANILINKVLPDLKAIDHSGETSVQVTAIKREIIF